MDDEADSFAKMFSGPPGEAQRTLRVERARKERRTQLTKKQRSRGGVRTTQINYRCSPAHREMAAGLAKHLDCSIADAMEEALNLLAEAKGYDGGEDAG
jgi:hypothetical protein